MAVISDNPVVWRFDGVVLDKGAFRVMVDGVARDLEPKSLRLLQLLIEKTADVPIDSVRNPHNATFAPDRPRMWFVNSQVNGNIGIWQLSLNPSTLTPVGEPTALSGSPFTVPHDLTLSADGKGLAFTAVRSQSAILAQSIAAIARLGLACFFAGISPDNSRTFVAAFQDHARKSAGRLTAHRLGDGASSDLTELPPGSSHWRCSSECGLVAFHSDLDGHERVYIKGTRLDAGHRVRLGGSRISPVFTR